MAPGLKPLAEPSPATRGQRELHIESPRAPRRRRVGVAKEFRPLDEETRVASPNPNDCANDCEQDSGTLIRSLERHQREWAAERKVEVDGAGLTLSLDANLISPLCQTTRADLSTSLPGILADGEKRGEMSALCSTAALVHNVFDYWRGRVAAPLVRACGSTQSQDPLELHFAATGPAAPTAVHTPGSPADVVLAARARPIVVAASFLEPYTQVDNRPAPELLHAKATWSGLQACRNLTIDLDSNTQRFQHLAVARLLGIGQSWTRELGERGFRLLYLWYDCGGRAADRVRAEIDRFRMRAGGELDFEARSWQEFFRELRGACRAGSASGAPASASGDPASAPGDDSHESYLQYLSSRYFPLKPSS